MPLGERRDPAWRRADTNSCNSVIMTPMCHRQGRTAVLISGCITACLIAACGTSPPHVRGTSSTTKTTTTTTTMPPTTSTPSTAPKPAGIAVPDVIGMKITPARFFLRVAGFYTVALSLPCNKGTLTSQSVVVSLSVPGAPPNRNVGAVPLVPGSTRPKHSFVGITWSGCYPEGAVVPTVAGLTFGAAVNLLHVAGLTWACYASATTTTTTTARPSTTTTRPAPTSTTTRPPSTTSISVATTTTTRPVATTAGTPSVSHAVTATTIKAPKTVLSQSPPPGTVLRAGAPVSFVMSACPQ